MFSTRATPSLMARRLRMSMARPARPASVDASSVQRLFVARAEGNLGADLGSAQAKAVADTPAGPGNRATLHRAEAWAYVGLLVITGKDALKRLGPSLF